MDSKRNFAYFLQNMREKHRLSMLSEHDQSEVWYMHISPLRLIAGFIALVLLLFIIILTTVAYTSVLDLIPGYPGNKSRELLVENIMRLDSLERQLTSMQMYADNVSLIMEGKTPVVRSLTGDSPDTAKSAKQGMVPPSRADSILRRQMEQQGPYHLSGRQGPGQSMSALFAPVEGVPTTHFSPRDGRFGVGIVTKSNQQVIAVSEGTIIMSLWSPDTGYVIQIQHTGNMVSTYRHCAEPLHPVGARVKGGEVIASTGDTVSAETGKGIFEFELWLDGTPVDPESYIVF